jgi:hypothetical protein
MVSCMLYKQILAQAGLPAEIVELLVATDRAIARGDLNSSSRDLHTLIGRDTQTLRDLLADTAHSETGKSSSLPSGSSTWSTS